MRADLGEAVTLEQSCDVRGLIAAVLQYQPAVGVEMRRRGTGYRGQGFQPRGSAAERERRLLPQVFKSGIGCGDIGRIGDDYVESFAGYGREPRSQAPID